MEMKLSLHAPLYDEVKAEAQKCGMTPTKFALEVIESFSATRRFWRTDLPVVEQQTDSVTETQAAVVKPGESACVNSESETRD
jgi:hypothetical protein